tara:strand:- start:295 stop:510 length:216 start_codon:yes stop_codon:yes gene_type:complete
MTNIYRMVDTKLVQLTDAEEKTRQAEEASNEKAITERKKAEETKATKKASAITKLKDLGLTDDEISALVGE